MQGGGFTWAKTLASVCEIVFCETPDAAELENADIIIAAVSDRDDVRRVAEKLSPRQRHKTIIVDTKANVGVWVEAHRTGFFDTADDAFSGLCIKRLLEKAVAANNQPDSDT